MSVHPPLAASLSCSPSLESSQEASIPDWARTASMLPDRAGLVVLKANSDANLSATHADSLSRHQHAQPQRFSPLSDDQKKVQLHLIQRQYAHHSASAQSIKNLHTSSNKDHPTTLENLSEIENNTGIDFAAISNKALNKAHSKRRPNNAHVQHYEDDVALEYDIALTPRTLFDRKRKTIARLTITLIMQLNIDQIRAIRGDFDGFPDGINMAQFVRIMTKHVYSPSLSFCPSPSLFLQSLVELFESMDLDGDHSLEWEELLSTIVHMGMGATDHLVLSPINPYRDGPEYWASKQQSDRVVFYHHAIQRLIYYEKDSFTFRLYDPSMRNAPIKPPIGQNSVLCCEYIAQYGKMDEMRIGGDDTRNDRASPDNVSGPAQPDLVLAQRKTESEKELLKVGQSSRKAEAEKRKADSFAFYKNALMASVESRKSKVLKEVQITAQKTGKVFGNGQWVTDPHSEECYYTVKERSAGSTRFGNDDLLVTATAHYLSLWEGLPNEPVLSDSKKVKIPYSSLTWCSSTQRLFAGDVQGGVVSWKIVNAVPVEQLNNNKWHASSFNRLQTVPKLVKERSFHGHKNLVTKIVTIPSMTFVLTSSLDHSVKMWDINTGIEKNTFQAHHAGVVDLTYSNEYRFLLSASIDHDVCVWSPFADQVVFKLVGHAAPLIGVQFVIGTPQIITADCEGWIKVWDARNFTCCQTWMSISNMSTFTHTGEKHARIFVAGRSSAMRCYDQEGGPYLKSADEDPIYSTLFSSLSLSFFTCNRQDIKLWNALNGRLSRVYRGLSNAPVTAFCFDQRERKLFIGDKAGKIRVYNALTGAYMKSLTPHEDEIIFLQYLGDKRELVSAASDRTVKVHDERPIEDQVVRLVLKLENPLEILQVAVNVEHSLIAIASSDAQIGIWSVESSLKDSIFIHKTTNENITLLSFLEPYPLIIVGDEAGNISAFHTRPSTIKNGLAFAFSLAQADSELVGGATAMHWNRETCSIIIGTMHGLLASFQLHPLIDTAMSVVEQHDREQMQGSQRNFQSISSDQNQTLRASPLSSPIHVKLYDFIAQSHYITSAIHRMCVSLKPTFLVHAHANAISSVSVTTAPVAIVSTARTHQVKVWSFKGELLGIMDSRQALAAHYAPTENKPVDTIIENESVAWKFVVDVTVKEKEEAELSASVMQDLEQVQEVDSKEILDVSLSPQKADKQSKSKVQHLQVEKYLPVHWQQIVQEGEIAGQTEDALKAWDNIFEEETQEQHLLDFPEKPHDYDEQESKRQVNESLDPSHGREQEFNLQSSGTDKISSVANKTPFTNFFANNEKKESLAKAQSVTFPCIREEKQQYEGFFSRLDEEQSANGSKSIFRNKKKQLPLHPTDRSKNQSRQLLACASIRSADMEVGERSFNLGKTQTANNSFLSNKQLTAAQKLQEALDSLDCPTQRKY